MKRIEYIKKMTTREIATEFYYFDIECFIKDNDNKEKVIKRLMKWLNEDFKTPEIEGIKKVESDLKEQTDEK